MRIWTILGVAVATCCLAAGEAKAGTIVGGSDLVSSGDLTQLETWLGEGSLTLTNIYDYASGDDAADFHAAADGQGRTISVYKVLKGSDHILIGGYNPQSWDAAIADYRYTPDLADRTAFIFNLTTGIKFDQLMDVSSGNAEGSFQTYNKAGYFPTFGGGHDLFAWDGGSSPSAASRGYGNGLGGKNLFGEYGTTSFTLESLEVFTITAQVVPLPPSALMGLTLLGGLGLAKVLRGRRRTALT